jgi:hypothetical protein
MAMMSRVPSHLTAPLVLAASLLLAPSPARGDAGDPVEQKVRRVQALVVEKPAGFEKDFAPSFLKAVPPGQVAAILADYHKKGGRVLSVLRSGGGPLAADYIFYAERATFPVKIGVTPEAPHLIHSLWFGVPAPSMKSLDEAVAALKMLPGKASLSLVELGGKSPRVVKALLPDEPLALGSAFKLYLLGALLEEIEARRMSWEQVVRLEGARKSLPSGVLQTWPDGAPLTLHTAAAQMISVSDNTATDLLLAHLGRERVEAFQRHMGHKSPERNRPFLSTREMFILKFSKDAAARLAAYLPLAEKERRALLDGELAKTPVPPLEDLFLGGPIAIDRVEWFASTADLCRAMAFFHGRASSAAGRAVLEILGINHGLVLSKEKWRRVGYKGGSEPGVLNLTWLLERKDGRAYALALTWNDPRKALDEQKLLGLAQGVLLLLETGAAPPSKSGAGAQKKRAP